MVPGAENREIVVRARETLIRRREQEYHQMERCPLCEKGNKRQVEGYNVHADLYVENSHERKMMRPHGERHKLLGNYIRNTGAGGASERSASPNILELLLFKSCTRTKRTLWMRTGYARI